MLKNHRRFPLLLVFLLGACASIPSGPSVMVLPGSGKTFDQFRGDDSYCKQYASEQVGGTTPNQAAVSSGAGTAAIGTGVGAAAGAAFGGGTGAAIGAGSGLLVGGLMGTGTARTSGYVIQQRYDMGYIQCMYAKGHRVPVSGQIMDSYRNQAPGANPPPPPPGNPPPPPPQ
ncbi:glycine zipper family protein [Nitrosospira sp. Nsp13]|jgi:hypothetical protein|uniref:glycine zipper family protein n=1 Tax=Nitrosospira sp. Nsp13 TaxID=1855332 RepID=UPI00087FE2A4|nr:glycine zipper family protein [Nitrosospira sp. Nsp13]SCX84367.1 Glycine-zipper containing OmpA-like membrane domain-containing protein [Nitrosospira sp. Nsp13]